MSDLTSMIHSAILPPVAALRERDFTSAKAQLSTVMDEVVHEHRPQIVVRKGRESMLLVQPGDVRRWLDTFQLDLKVSLDEGAVGVLAQPIGVVGAGASLDAALDDLLENIRAYVVRYFDRQQFYSQTSAVKHEPWLARFALTPLDEQRQLLESDSAPR